MSIQTDTQRHFLQHAGNQLKKWKDPACLRKGQRMARLCHRSLNTAWILLFCAPLVIILSAALQSGPLVYIAMIWTPLAVAGSLLVHIVSFILSRVLYRAHHQKSAIVYYVLSDVFFLLLVGLIDALITDPPPFPLNL